MFDSRNSTWRSTVLATSRLSAAGSILEQYFIIGGGVNSNIYVPTIEAFDIVNATFLTPVGLTIIARRSFAGSTSTTGKYT